MNCLDTLRVPSALQNVTQIRNALALLFRRGLSALQNATQTAKKQISFVTVGQLVDGVWIAAQARRGCTRGR